MNSMLVHAPGASPHAFHVMAKPGGALCNLDCTYCYYLGKAALHPKGAATMAEDVLERFVADYIRSHPAESPVVFGWQGGEPTLAGIDFYRKAVEFQTRYAGGRRIENTFQTNGTLLDAGWCRFLADHRFLVGLSLDGPAELHDRHRTYGSGRPSHEDVMRALGLLQAHDVDFNLLACVNRDSARRPLDVYDFLRATGARFIQFIPVVERPGGPGAARGEGTVTGWSLEPGDYGQFLTAVFEQWLRRDLGRIVVMNFEWVLANFMGLPGAVCHHQPVCGRSVVIERNGDIYACDHFVDGEHRLGNVAESSLSALVDSPVQQAFGFAKFDALPHQCRKCDVLRSCWGGCPKHRFMASADGEPGLNYLCPGYRQFFRSVAPSLERLARLVS